MKDGENAKVRSYVGSPIGDMENGGEAGARVGQIEAAADN